jgi:hypothetical protein
VLAVTWPSFSAYFLGEDFSHWGAYLASGRSLTASLLQPHDGIFFRPVPRALTIGFNLLLPPEPLLYHLRNYAFIAGAIAFLYLFLIEIRTPRLAAMLAAAFLSVSKIHATTIGYTASFDSVAGWFNAAAALYFLARALARGRRLDLVLHYVFTLLAVASRDYGIVILLPLSLAWLLASGRPLRQRVFAVAGYAAAGAAYLLARAMALARVRVDAGPPYSVTMEGIGHRAAALWGNIWNLSLDAPNTTGPGTLALLPSLTLERRHTVEAVALVLMTALFAWTILPVLRNRWAMAGLAWTGAFLLPVTLVRATNVYYSLDALTGVFICLALAIAARGRAAVRGWAGVIVALLVLAFADASQQRLYSWRYSADQVKPAVEAARAAAGSQASDGVAFAASSKERAAFWNYALTADWKAPLLPVVFGRPGLRVEVVEPGAAATVGGVQLIESAGGFQVRADLAIRRIHPDTVRAGEPFNAQPDGSSAIWIDCAGATPSTVVWMDDHALPTSYGGPNAVSALVPRQLIAQRGARTVKLRDASGRESQPAAFTVSRRPVH